MSLDRNSINIQNTINITNSNEAELMKLKSQMEAIRGESERLTSQLEEAKWNAECLGNELASFKTNNGIKILEEELDRFRRTAEQSANEFEAFLQTVNLKQLYNFDEGIFRGLFEDIRDGSKTASQAILEVKTNYRALMEESYNSSGGLFDSQTVQQFTQAMERLGSTLDVVLGKIENIEQNGVRAIGEIGASASGGGSGVAGIADILKQLEKATSGMSAEAKEAYAPITNLIQAIVDYGNIDTTKILGISQAFRNIADIGSGSYGTKSINNIVYLAKQLQVLSENGGGAIRFDFTGLNELKVSKASVSNLATYLPQIADINAENLERLSKINLTNFNNVKVSKGSIESIAKLADAMRILKETKAAYVKDNGNSISIETNSVNPHAELEKVSNAKDTIEQIGNVVTGQFTIDKTPIVEAGSKELLDGIKVSLDRMGASAPAILKINEALEEQGMVIDKVTSKLVVLKEKGQATEKYLLIGVSASGKNGTAYSWDMKVNETGYAEVVADSIKVAENFKKTQDTAKQIESEVVKGSDKALSEVMSSIKTKDTEIKKATIDYNKALVAGDEEAIAHHEHILLLLKEELAAYEKRQEVLEGAGAVSSTYADRQSVLTRSELEVAEAKRQEEADRDSKVAIAEANAKSKELSGVMTQLKALDSEVSNANTELAKAFAKDDAEAYNYWDEKINELNAKIKLLEEAKADLEAAGAETSTYSNRESALEKNERAEANAAWKAEQDTAKQIESEVVKGSDKALSEVMSSIKTKDTEIKKATIDYNKALVAGDEEAIAHHEARLNVLNKELDALKERKTLLEDKGAVSSTYANREETLARYNREIEEADWENNRSADADITTSKIKKLTELQKAMQDAYIQQEKFTEGSPERSEYEDRIEDLVGEYEDLNATLSESAKASDEYKAHLDACKKAEASATAVVNERKEANSDAVKAQTKITSALSTADKALEYTASKETDAYRQIVQAKEELSDMQSGVKEYDIQRIEELTASIKVNKKWIEENGGAHKKFGDTLAANAKKYLSWFSASELIMTAWRYFKQMVNTVIELDAAMTEVRKVTDETDATYRSFLDNAVSRTKELGTSLTDVINATADFARLGYGIEDASALADTAIVYKNVGDGLSDIGEASESIISTMQAFGVEADDAMSIVDKFNEVGNNYAITSAGVGEALLNSASAMASANNTLDETIALITAANTVVQDPEKVGTSLKTVSMYLRAAKTEAEDAGESTDGMAESVSELRDELLSLTGQKVDIMDGDSFKSTYQIMKELASVWNELSDISQANILEIIGGKRNSNVVSALLSSFSVAENALTTSMNSAGSALHENEIYLDSVTGRIQTLKASTEGFAESFVNDDALKFVIEIVDGLVEAGTALNKIHVLLPAITATIAAIQVGKTFGKIKESSSGITRIMEALSGYGTLSDATDVEFGTKLRQTFSSMTGEAQNFLLKSKEFNGLTKKLSEIEGFDATRFINALQGIQTAGEGAAESMGGVAKGALTGIKTFASLHPVLTAVTVAFTVASAAFTIYQSYLQKVAEQMQELANTQEELDDIADSVDTYKTRIEELKKSLDSGTLSEQEAYETRQELLGVQDEIIDSLGKEAGAFDVLGDSIDTVNGKLDAFVIKQAERALHEDEKTVSRTIKGVEEDRTWTTGRLKNSMTNEDSVPYMDVVEVFKDVFGDGISEVVSKHTGYKTFELAVDVDAKGAREGLDEVYSRLEELDKKYQEQQGTTLSEALGIDSWKSVVAELQGAVDDYLADNGLEDLYDNIVQNKIIAIEEYRNTYAAMTEAEQDYVDAVADNDITAQKNAIEAFKEAYAGFSLLDPENDTGVQEYVEGLYNAFVEETAKHQFVIDVQFGTTDSARGTAGKRLLNFINRSRGEDGTILASDVLEDFQKIESKGSGGYAALKSALDYLGLSIEDVLYSMNGLNGVVYDLGDASESTAASVVKFTEAVDSLTKANDVLVAAQKDIEESGSLTYDTLENLIEVLAEFEPDANWVDYLIIEDGQLRLNAGAWKELTEAKRQATLEIYQGNITELQSEKSLIDAQISAIIGGRGNGETGNTLLSEEEKKNYVALTTKAKELGSQIQATTSEMEAYAIATKGAAVATGDAARAFGEFDGTIEDFGSKFKEAKENVEEINEAIEEYGNKEVLTQQETAELISQFPSLITQLTKTEDGYILNADALHTLKNAEISEASTMMQAEVEKARQILASTDTITASLIDQIEAFEAADNFMQQYLASATAAGIKASTVSAMKGLDVTKVDVANKTYTLSNGETVDISGAEYADILSWGQTYQNALNLENLKKGYESYDIESVLSSLKTSGSSSGSGGGSSSTEQTAQEKLEEALNTTIANLDHDIFLLQQVGGKEDEIRALLDKEQGIYAYYGQAFRNLGEGENSEYIRSASEGWWGVEDSKYNNFQSIISNIDHEIAVLEQQGSKQEELIALYRQKQAAEEEYTAYLESYGLANSAAAQELGEQWWSEQESINTLYSELYEQAVSNNSYRITGLQRTENGGTTQNAQDIISIYKEMMASTYAEIERYTELGAEKYNEEIQSLQESAWGFRDEIDAVLESIVSDASSALDTAQSLYDTLLSAGNEYATNGYLSIDTYQELLSLGPEYLAYLIDENGQLTINEQRIQALIKAKTEQYGIQTALNYVTSLQAAIDDNNTDALNRLLYATEAANASTWELVYSQIYLMNLTAEQQEAAIGVVQGIQSVCDSAVMSIARVNDEANDAVEELQTELEELKEMQEGANDILDLTMDMVQDMVEQEIDGIEELKNKYSELIEAKKESLQATKDEDDYEKSKANQIKSISKLQEQIDLLSLDDSREAQAERTRLQEEMAELQDELAEDQADYALDKTLDSLDEMEEAYSEEKDKEIKILEDSISSTQKIYEKAIRYIDENWDTLYDDLISWNYQYGSTLEQDLVDSWEKAYEAAERYGSLVEAITSIDLDIEAVQEKIDAASDTNSYVRSASGNIVIADKTSSGSLNAAKTAASSKKVQETKKETAADENDDIVRNIVDIMKNNAASWNRLAAQGDTTLNARKRLAARNLALGSSLSQYGVTAWRDEPSGVWYVQTSTGKKKLFDVYHSGGVVGGGDSESNEQLALLKKNEWVLTERMANNLTHMMDLIDMLGRASLKLGTSSKILQNGFSETIANGMASLNSITTNQPIQITFGDTIINGADGNTLEQHVAVDRDMVNQIAKILKVKL